MNTRLTSAVLFLLFGVLLLVGAPASAEDFEAEYEGLIKQFATSLPDSAAVEGQVDDADDLYDRIRAYRKEKRDDLSEEELDRLRDLSREVRRFKGVARVVGQIHNAADTSIEGFDLVNGRLGLEPEVILTHESGLELVRIDVDKFTSILFRNPTQVTFSVTYSVNDPERPGGVGSAFCEKYSVLSGLFNSRDRELEGLEFTIQVRESEAGGCD